MSFNRFGNAIWALTLREFRTQYGDRKLGLFWAFAEPCGYLFVMNVVIGAIRTQQASPLTGSFAAYFAIGFWNYSFFNGVERSVRGGVRGNRNLLSFPRVKPIDIFLSRFITEVVVLCFVFGTILFVFYIFGMVPTPERPLELVPPFICSMFYGLGMGLINASIISYYRTWENIYGVFQRVNFFTSGVFFLARDWPDEVQRVLFYQPLLHSAEWLRSAWYNDYESHFMVPAVPVWTAIVIFLLGLIGERVSRRRQLGNA